MTDQNPPSDDTLDAVTKQAIRSLTYVRRDQKELLDSIKQAIKDGTMPVSKPLLDKLSELFCKTTNIVVAESIADTFYEAAMTKKSEPYIIDYITQLTRHSLENGNEDIAVALIDYTAAIVKTKKAWADVTVNDTFQTLKEIKIPATPTLKEQAGPVDDAKTAADDTAKKAPLAKIERAKNVVFSKLNKLSSLFNPKAAPQSKLNLALSRLQLTFDEVLIYQFNDAIDKNEKSKGTIYKLKHYIRRFKNDLSGN